MCKTNDDCIKPATCSGGICRDVAMDELADTEPQQKIDSSTLPTSNHAQENPNADQD